MFRLVAAVDKEEGVVVVRTVKQYHTLVRICLEKLVVGEGRHFGLEVLHVAGSLLQTKKAVNKLARKSYKHVQDVENNSQGLGQNRKRKRKRVISSKTAKVLLRILEF